MKMKLYHSDIVHAKKLQAAGCRQVSEGNKDQCSQENMGWMLASLDERYSLPFLLFYRGHECQEIADHLRLPVEKVKNRIFVARHKLRTILKTHQPQKQQPHGG